MSNLILFIFFLMMTTLSPWVGGTQHQQEFDPFSIDLFDPKTSLLPSGFGRNWWDRDDTTTNMHTSVDWTETPESHIFRVDIPGARKDEVNVQVEDGNVLNISGKRTKVEKKDIDTWHLAERKHGGFKRRFKMPENANMDDVECILEHGVLTVTVPKKEIMKPARNVEIK